jgi:hypothetical protein
VDAVNIILDPFQKQFNDFVTTKIIDDNLTGWKLRISLIF